MSKLPKLSIAAKLYSIFGLLAIVTAGNAVVSNINNRQNAQLSEEVAVAAQASENIERVKSEIDQLDELIPVPKGLTALRQARHATVPLLSVSTLDPLPEPRIASWLSCWQRRFRSAISKSCRSRPRRKTRR